MYGEFVIVVSLRVRSIIYPTRERGLTMPATTYKRDYCDIAESACADLGATEGQLAKMFKVNVMTIQAWKKRHKEFNAAIRRGKYEADSLIEQSLYRRARGYAYKEKTTSIKNEDGTWTTTNERIALPDTTACIKWLHNRRRDEWKPDQQIVEVVQSSQVKVIKYVADNADAKASETVSNG